MTMGTKKKKIEPTQEPSLLHKQLWIVERKDLVGDEKTPRKIYVYADRWYDVREAGSMKLEVRGDYDKLFISTVMAKINVFADPKVLVYDVQYTGNASNNTLEKKVVQLRAPGFATG